MSFRPTCRQAFGRGGYLGGLVGLIFCLGGVALALTGVSGLLGLTGPLIPLLPVLPLPAGLLLGSLLGPVLCRHEGADIDDQGIRCVRRRDGGHTAWQRIEDLRAERRGGRTRVAIYQDSGKIGWLRAPYSGRFLATDPEFERKLFMLRNVLATHRSFALTQRQGDNS